MIFFIAMLTFFLEGKIIGMKPIKQAFFLCKAFLVFLNEDSLCASYLILNVDFFFFFVSWAFLRWMLILMLSIFPYMNQK